MPTRVKSNIKYAREAVPFDKGSILLIQELHPDIRHDAFELATSCWNIGIPLRVYRTRTTKMEQDFLYEFGRTVPGSFYTTSRGGSSLEEMGFVMNVGIVSFENDTWISYEEVLPSNQHRRLHWFWWRHVIHEFKHEDGYGVIVNHYLYLINSKRHSDIYMENFLCSNTYIPINYTFH